MNLICWAFQHRSVSFSTSTKTCVRCWREARLTFDEMVEDSIASNGGPVSGGLTAAGIESARIAIAERIRETAR